MTAVDRKGARARGRPSWLIGIRWLHQREEFVDRVLRHQADAIGIVHPHDIDAVDDGLDLVAEVREKAQGIARFVRHARNQPRDQDLTRDHLSVQLVHLSSSLAKVRHDMTEQAPIWKRPPIWKSS